MPNLDEIRALANKLIPAYPARWTPLDLSKTTCVKVKEITHDPAAGYPARSVVLYIEGETAVSFRDWLCERIAEALSKGEIEQYWEVRVVANPTWVALGHFISYERGLLTLSIMDIKGVTVISMSDDVPWWILKDRSTFYVKIPRQAVRDKSFENTGVAFDDWERGLFGDSTEIEIIDMLRKTVEFGTSKMPAAKYLVSFYIGEAMWLIDTYEAIDAAKNAVLDFKRRNKDELEPITATVRKPAGEDAVMLYDGERFLDVD